MTKSSYSEVLFYLKSVQCKCINPAGRYACFWKPANSQRDVLFSAFVFVVSAIGKAYDPCSSRKLTVTFLSTFIEVRIHQSRKKAEIVDRRTSYGWVYLGFRAGNNTVGILSLPPLPKFKYRTSFYQGLTRPLFLRSAYHRGTLVSSPRIGPKLPPSGGTLRGTFVVVDPPSK